MPFVFATSHSDKSTVDRAKQALPYAYLIKPFNEDDLYAVIETALMHFSNKKQASNEEKNDGLIIIHDGIFVKVRNRFVKLSLDDLLYIEANDNYCTLVTKGGSYVLKTTLKGLLDLLPGQFWRIHRSYVINLNHLKGFDTNEVWVPEKSLPLGKSFYPLLMERLKIVHG
jgi:DNA-binding LytR/AlgR family response regulator